MSFLMFNRERVEEKTFKVNEEKNINKNKNNGKNTNERKDNKK